MIILGRVRVSRGSGSRGLKSRIKEKFRPKRGRLQTQRGWGLMLLPPRADSKKDENGEKKKIHKNLR